MYAIFEGIDGCGKDTQAELLQKYLRYKGAILVSEPYEPLTTGTLLRKRLKTGLHPESHAALFLANRLELQESVIVPSLEADIPVISVRSFLSTIVYQQDQWPLPWLWRIHTEQLAFPDVVFLLDIDPKVGLERAHKRGGHIEVYEKLPILERNRMRYLDAVEHDARLYGCVANPCVVEVLDGTKSIQALHEEIIGILTEAGVV